MVSLAIKLILPMLGCQKTRVTERRKDERHPVGTILENWIVETGDRVEVAETAISLRPTYELWKDKPIFKGAEVNPEYDQFR